jgi:hypothetical protein
MTRPLKYDTAKEAAEASLYSKMGGAARTGLTLEKFVSLVTAKCDVCGQHPTEHLAMNRKDDSYILWWNYIAQGVTVCGTCKKLAIHFDLDRMVRHCARIMAKRGADKRREAKRKQDYSDGAQSAALAAMAACRR